jgi:ribose transport system permease protein
MTPQAASVPAETGHGIRLARVARVSFQHLERWGLLVAWAAVVGAAGGALGREYFSSGNLQAIFGSQAVLLVLALGVIIPLVGGEFDLSAASNLAFASMIISVLNVQHGWGIIPAIAVGLAASVAVGVVNGTFVAIVGVNSFIVTLGTGTVLLGIVELISNDTYVTGITQGLTNWTVGHEIAGISIMFYYALAAAVLLFYFFEYTPLGRRLIFVGSSANVSRLSGLHVRRIRWGSFVASALFAGIAGTLYAGSLNGADPASGQSFLLPAFTAAYLGATAVIPGQFNPFGTVIAVFFLASGITALQLLGLQNFVQQLFYGTALVVAVTLSHVARRRRS